MKVTFLVALTLTFSAANALTSTAAKTCTGWSSSECPSGQFCLVGSKTKGTSDEQCRASGICTRKPDASIDIYAPVCGCDGLTYSNEGDAHVAGVSVSYTGECEMVPHKRGCGNTRMGLLECGAKEVCVYEGNNYCGATGGMGSCEDRPDISTCRVGFAPVCGCDGLTYGSQCFALANGTGVKHVLACGSGQVPISAPVKPDDELMAEVVEMKRPCGLTRGGHLTCEDDEVCAYGPNDWCGAADAPGVCQKKPALSSCRVEFAAVCGCDGHTYSGNCFALANGTSVAHVGACAREGDAGIGGATVYQPEEEERGCGVVRGYSATCETNEICVYPGETNPCGKVPAWGVCQQRPDPATCVPEFAAVCGCDGNTYSGNCYALSKGINIAHVGACVHQAPLAHPTKGDQFDGQFGTANEGDVPVERGSHGVFGGTGLMIIVAIAIVVPAVVVGVVAIVVMRMAHSNPFAGGKAVYGAPAGGFATEDSIHGRPYGSL